MAFVRFRLLILGAFLLIAGSLSGLSLFLLDHSQSAQITLDVQHELVLARSIFNHLIERRGAQSQTGASLLASDYALKRALSKDPATIESSALNLRHRIGADAVWLINEDGILSADTTHGLSPGKIMKDMPIVMEALQGKQKSSIETIGTATYQLAAVPINAPEPIGALMVGFRINDASAAELKRLLGADISFTSGGRLFASTLANSQRRALEAALPGVKAEAVPLRLYNDERRLLLAAPISLEVTAYLERSLDDALEPLKRLQRYLVLINIFGLGMTALAGYLVTEGVTSTIQRMNDELALLNRFQAQFFAVVAHDVNNPLSVAMGYAYMLKNSALTPENRKFVDHLGKSLAALEFMISDLVDFASIEVGKLRIELKPLDLGPVLEDISTRMTITAQKRGVTFEAHWPQTLPAIAGDGQRLAQVLQNLCSNAINYTSASGRVRLNVEALPEKLQVSVVDSGIGISPEDIPKIFNRFFQAENARAYRGGGLGLGLKIAQEIIIAHGGNIEVSSVIGKGSTFRFTLPKIGII